jgi:UDP-N-acetylglucosamine 2-epimerase (non-hydrolysing)
MSIKPRILMVMGTRPEIIKMAPIYCELEQRGVDPLLLHTGQHNELAMPQYEFFDIKPDYIVDLQRNHILYPEKPYNAGHDLSTLSGDLLSKISELIVSANPSTVMVHGDTSSGLMGALAAFYHQVPIAHVEAGLRSHIEYNPFPEEMNRVMMARLARWHFAPTERAQKNLLAEGIVREKIHVVGNTIIEATRLGIERLPKYLQAAENSEYQFLKDIIDQHEQKKIVMVTMHRRENQAVNVMQITSAIKELLEKYEDMLVVWPIHPNPKIRAAIHNVIGDSADNTISRLHLLKPLSYPLFLWVMQHAWLVLTDSGGIQEESVALQIPVLILRDTTERPEVVEAGIGILAGTEKGSILHHVASFYRNPSKRESWRQAENPFGNGTAAKRICDILLAASDSAESLPKTIAES